jgi:hypothetical protein
VELGWCELNPCKEIIFLNKFNEPLPNRGVFYFQTLTPSKKKTPIYRKKIFGKFMGKYYVCKNK